MSVGLNTRKPKPSVELQKLHTPSRYSIGVLTDPKDEMVDLSAEQINRAYELTRSDGLKNLVREAHSCQEGRKFRTVRSKENGLRLLYPLRPDADAYPMATKPFSLLRTVRISFPPGSCGLP